MFRCPRPRNAPLYEEFEVMGFYLAASSYSPFSNDSINSFLSFSSSRTLASSWFCATQSPNLGMVPGSFGIRAKRRAELSFPLFGQNCNISWRTPIIRNQSKVLSRVVLCTSKSVFLLPIRWLPLNQYWWLKSEWTPDGCRKLDLNGWRQSGKIELTTNLPVWLPLPTCSTNCTFFPRELSTRILFGLPPKNVWCLTRSLHLTHSSVLPSQNNWTSL